MTQYTKPQKTNTLQKCSNDEQRGELGITCIEICIISTIQETVDIVLNHDKVTRNDFEGFEKMSIESLSSEMNKLVNCVELTSEILSHAKMFDAGVFEINWFESVVISGMKISKCSIFFVVKECTVYSLCFSLYLLFLLVFSVDFKTSVGYTS